MELEGVITLSAAFAECASRKECTNRKLRRTIAMQRSKYNKLKTEMQQKIKQSDEALTQRIETLNVLIADFQQQIADLTVSLAHKENTHKTEITQLTARINDLQSKITIYEKLLNSMPQKYSKLYTELSVFCTGLARITAECCVREIVTMLKNRGMKYTAINRDDMNVLCTKLNHSLCEYLSSTPFKSIESIYKNFYSLQ